MKRNTACVVWPVLNTDIPDAHVTVVFLGEVVDKPAMFSILIDALDHVMIPTIGEVPTKGLAVFGPSDNPVIVAELLDEELSKWNSLLLNKLFDYGIKDGSAFGGYRPHVTLGKELPSSVPESYNLGSPELWWGDYKLPLKDFGILPPSETKTEREDYPEAPEGVSVAAEVASHARPQPAVSFAPPAGRRRWDIWAEGYAATGESGGATNLGFGYGDTFDEAVEYLVRLVGPKLGSSFTYDEQRGWRYWGCRLFDNRLDAQRSFG